MNKRLLSFGVVLLILVFFVFLHVPQDCNAVDLFEAYQIAHSEALNWDAAAKPYFITTVDDNIKSSTIKGEDGKRNYWNFDFVIVNTNRHLIITLHDKTIENKIETESYTNNDYIINMSEVCVSTAEAVMEARDNFGLLPGVEWAQGYHFVLENDGSALTLSVIGVNHDGTMSRVLFNAKTGEVID